MSDGLAHALHLAVPALVERELDASERPASEDADACGCGRAVVELDAVAEPRDDVGRRRALRRRPRRPSEPRTADGRAGARGRRRSSGGARRSCRCRAARPGRRAAPAARDRRRSAAPADRSRSSRHPRACAGARTRAAAARRAHRRPRRRRACPTTVFSSPGSPFTRTRPSRMSSSARRRDATPARAR